MPSPANRPDLWLWQSDAAMLVTGPLTTSHRPGWGLASGRAASLTLALVCLGVGVLVTDCPAAAPDPDKAKAETAKAEPAPAPLKPAYVVAPTTRDPFKIPVSLMPLPPPPAGGEKPAAGATIDPSADRPLTDADVVAAVTMQGVMVAGAGKYIALLNGQPLSIGGKVAVTLRGKVYTLEVVKVSGEPSQVVLKYNGKDYVKNGAAGK